MARPEVLIAMVLLPRLYAIVDSSAHDSTQRLLAFADALAAGGCTLLQYRNKSGDARFILEQGRQLKKHLGDSVRLIMNDRDFAANKSIEES